ncbi:collagen alpha-1(XXI) chain-like [Lampetra planeri]
MPSTPRGQRRTSLARTDFGLEDHAELVNVCKVTSRNKTMIVLLKLLVLFAALGEAQQELDYRAGCRTAANEMVFVLDGSWSVEPQNFETVKRWLVNISSSFDIGLQYTQVGVIQYSDWPQLEIPLGAQTSNEQLMAALGGISYLGGNTKTGRAIQFVTRSVFPASPRADSKMVRTVVVVTDGKSQDNVTIASLEAKENRIIMFAIGVGQAIEEAELKEIANRPSSSYVFYVEDYNAISRIKETIKQKLCEETVCPGRIPSRGQDEKGFDLLEGMRIYQKAERKLGSIHSEVSFSITSRMDFTEKTREILPEGLPPSYVFVATVRLEGAARREAWDLWRVRALDGSIQVAVTLDGSDRSVTFSSPSLQNGVQTARFSGPSLWKLFNEKWHQLRVLVREGTAYLFLDGDEVGRVVLEQVVAMYVGGQMQVGKYVGKEASIPFEVQKLRIYCDPEQNERETACEIPSVDDERCEGDRLPPAQAPPCTCPPGPSGPPGTPGKKSCLPQGFELPPLPSMTASLAEFHFVTWAPLECKTAAA